MNDVPHDSFYSVLYYIYFGSLTSITNHNNDINAEERMTKIVSMLELADRYVSDYLKQVCEVQLNEFVNRARRLSI